MSKNKMSWRERCRPIIAAALAEARAAGLAPDAEYALISARYPFGAREYHPYKIWLDEIKRQRSAPSVPQGRPVFGGAIVDTHEYTPSAAALVQKVSTE